MATKKFDLKPEMTAKIQAVADSKKVTVISLVAPLNPVRVSPAQLARAEITETEMFELERAVKKSTSNKLHLVVHTPGGELFTSYKIAAYLRKKFTNISVFIPYRAASGGTLICCAANAVYMGDLANLTPVDPQTYYARSYVSAYAFERAVDQFQADFGELSPDEIPSPYQQMASKFDPITLDEMNRLVGCTVWYANDLLEQSGYEELRAWRLAVQLVKTSRPHAHALMKEDAVKLGFEVKQDDAAMNVYSELVSECLKAESGSHIIRAFYPESSSEKEDNAGAAKKKLSRKKK